MEVDFFKIGKPREHKLVSEVNPLVVRRTDDERPPVFDLPVYDLENSKDQAANNDSDSQNLSLGVRRADVVKSIELVPRNHRTALC